MTPAEVEARRADLCASYQQAVVDALVRKSRAALRQGGGEYRSVGLSGGVANNAVLRAAMAAAAASARVPFLAAEPRHTGDNAGMIAFAAWADPAGVDRTAQLDLRIAPGTGLT
jgi:N6-L-threonylcarbamoyladenine synthase